MHPSLAAWNTLLKAHRGESGPAVADCPACGQPLIASGPLTAAPSWTLRTPSGDVVVAPRGIATPKGPMTWEEADVFLNESLTVREPVRPFTAIWELGLLTFSTVPFVMWVVAVFLVLWFLYNTTTGTIGY